MAKNKKKLTGMLLLLSISSAAELKSKSEEMKKSGDFPPGFIP
jgi:hypothetical protein